MRSILPDTHNPALRQVSRPLSREEITSESTRELIADMRQLLAKEEFGVALAAPQVGEAVRLFIVSGRAIARASQADDDESEPEPLPDQVYINPELVSVSRAKRVKHEGCLSIRGRWGLVPRAEKATVRAYDERGVLFTRGASGFLAHIFQHEMDHLEGILYTDKATELYDDDKPGQS